MQIYINFGRYWWLALPLLLLGLFSDLFMYAYWAAYVLLTLNLIFERTEGPIDSPASSINVYNQETRVNWLNLGIAVYLAFSNILVILIPLKAKVILIALFWGLGAWLLRKYIVQVLDLIHKQSMVTYLRFKLPDVQTDTLKQIVAVYFPGELPQPKPIQTRFGLNETQSEKLIHYYQRYIQNNYLNADLSGENKTTLPESA